MTAGPEPGGGAPHRASGRLRFQELDLETWSREISPLWNMEGAAAAIPPTVNGHGQLQYCGAELARRVRFLPVAAELDGVRVAWTSIYNISDQGLRLRGIYVLAQWRSNGIGRALVDDAIGRWPAQWDRVFLYARGANVARYRRWGFEVVPGHAPRLSRYGLASPPGLIVQMMRLRTPGARAIAR
jgi:GNAT superfamily N-acetyltransferase